MTEYEQHINSADEHLLLARDKVHADEGIRHALIGIGEVLLAREKREQRRGKMVIDVPKEGK